MSCTSTKPNVWQAQPLTEEKDLESIGSNESFDDEEKTLSVMPSGLKYFAQLMRQRIDSSSEISDTQPRNLVELMPFDYIRLEADLLHIGAHFDNFKG